MHPSPLNNIIVFIPLLITVVTLTNILNHLFPVPLVMGTMLASPSFSLFSSLPLHFCQLLTIRIPFLPQLRLLYCGFRLIPS